jgi:hypothetical protein
VLVGVVWGVFELLTCGCGIAGVGFGVGIGVGIIFGSSVGLTWGLGLGFGVGILLDLLVGTAGVGSGACGWAGSMQGAGAPGLTSCSGAVIRLIMRLLTYAVVLVALMVCSQLKPLTTSRWRIG